MHNKIKSLEEIENILKEHKKHGDTIVQCHGVFDLLHPGHIRHFKQAKKRGDKLVVSITPDKFVNKGPGRPAFNEKLRIEAIAALSSVDYVVMNDSKDAINAIKHIKPNFYVKGREYNDPKKDITGKIVDEEIEVKKNGGQIYFTDNIPFSSSSLLNKYVDPLSETAKRFIEKLKNEYTIDQIKEKIDKLANLKVLIIGDAIIDEYQYVDSLGQSAKGQHLVASCKDRERFLGGSLIIANHMSEFSSDVTLLTNLGKDCDHLNFINENLNDNVKLESIFHEKYSTLLKKRYVLKDGTNLTKLFETYSSNDDLLNQKNIVDVKKFIHENANSYDLVLVCDFGNGFLNKELKKEISKVHSFLAINSQINSGNRGYNVVTQYERADFISLNGPEIRLAAHDKESAIEDVTKKIAKKMRCGSICVTLGVKGSYCFSSLNHISQIIPAFATNSIDRVGAGDSFFSLSALCMASRYSPILSSYIGAIAAAIDVNIVGNKEHVKKEEMLKFLVRMFK